VASPERPPIIFVRHGETDWNCQGLIQGWTDTALNERGHRQARGVAAALASAGHVEKGAAYVTSPLLRARQTMAHVAEAFGLEPERIETDAAVQELGFGIWEGRPFWELKASPIYPAHPEERYDWRPEGGESYADGEARIGQWLLHLERPAVVVAHGAIGRCLIAMISGLERARLVELAMPQGCYCRLARGQAEWFDATADAA
jgi:probable phosphoglycerate mutase